MIEALFAYLVSGQFWFAMFLAGIAAVYFINRWGYGRSGVTYFEATQTKIQLMAAFVVFAVLMAAAVAGVVAGVHSVI